MVECDLPKVETRVRFSLPALDPRLDLNGKCCRVIAVSLATPLIMLTCNGIFFDFTRAIVSRPKHHVVAFVCEKKQEKVREVVPSRGVDAVERERMLRG